MKNRRRINRCAHAAAIGALLLGLAVPSQAQQPAAVPKFTFHGNPFFPIALYNYAVAGGASSQSPASLREMAAAGFNTLLQYDHSPAWESSQPPVTPSLLSTDQRYAVAVVDELWTYNLTTDDWIEMPSFFQKGSALYNQVSLLGSHPNLFGWETFDESLGYLGGQSLPDLQQGYAFVKSIDPNHPVLSNENPVSTYAAGLTYMPWASIGDCLSDDWYPVEAGGNMPWPLYGVPNSVDYLRTSVSDANAPYVPTKPVYAVLQGGPATPNGPTPSFANDRYMMYSSIIHGASAAQWWGSYQLHPTDQMWLDLKRCAGELRDLEPVLENGYPLGVDRGDAALGASYTTSNVVLGNSNLEAVGYWYYEPSGTIDNYVIVTNKSTAQVTSSIAVGGWNAARNGNKTRVLFETNASSGNNRAMISTSTNSWTDTFQAYDVHVYTDRKQNSVAMDFDGDGVADTATFDPTTGDAVITYSSSGKKVWVACPSGTTAVHALDVDGDGKVDIAAYNASLNNYQVLLSTTNYTVLRTMATVAGTTLPVLATPTGLTVTGSGTQAVLSWPAATGAASYTIYRSSVSGNEGVTPYITGITATTYTDTGLTNFNNYYYTIAAVNSAGFTSDQSNEAHWVPGPAFGNELAWDDGSNLYLQFNYTGAYGQFWAYLDTDDNPGTGFLYDGVGANYVLQNNDLSLDADPSNIYSWDFSYSASVPFTNTGSQITWSVPFTAVGSPSSANIVFEGVGPNTADPTVIAYTASGKEAVTAGLVITAGSGQNTLSWSAIPGASSYNVYRSTTSGAEGTVPYASGITTASYTDSSVVNGNTYYYTIAAVNGSVTSAQCGEERAKPWTFSNEEAWHDATNFYYRCDFNAPFVNFNVLLDTDNNPATGYAFWGIGSDYMIENSALYKSASNGPAWNWTYLSSPATVTTLANDNAVIISIPLASIGTPATAKVVIQGFDVNWNGATDTDVLTYQN